MSDLVRAMFQRHTKQVSAPSVSRFRPGLETFEERTVPTVVSIVPAPPSLTEGSNGVFSLVRDDNTSPLLVNVSISGTATGGGTDYTLGSTPVFFPPGAWSVELSVSTANDTTSEPTETIIATLASGTGYTIGSPSSATMSILDNDAQVVSVEKIADATEGGSNGTFRFTRTGDLSSSLTANFSVSGTATSGDDFTSLGTTVTFAANSATADKTVTPVDDDLDDPNETVDITIGSGIGYSIGVASAEMHIADNPPAGKVSEALIDFANLPAAGTGYTLKITLVGTNTDTSKTITIENPMGVNSPEDTRNAVKNAIRPATDSAGWEVEAVGTTKLKIKRYYISGYTDANGYHPAVTGEVDKIKIESKDLKDNQLPKYSLTRVAATDFAGDRAVASTNGGSWALGFETNADASTLADGVVMNVTVHTASGSVPVAITLTSGMTPSDIASAVADALTDEGFAFSASGSVATLDDGDEIVEYIEVSYTSTGSSPTVDWLTETIGFTAY